MSSETKCESVRLATLRKLAVPNGRDTVSNTDDNRFKSSDREYESDIAMHLLLNVDGA